MQTSTLRSALSWERTDATFHMQGLLRRQGKARGGCRAQQQTFSRGGIEGQVICGTPLYVELLCRFCARKAMPPRNLAAAISRGRLNFVLVAPSREREPAAIPARQLLASAAEERIS